MNRNPPHEFGDRFSVPRACGDEPDENVMDETGEARSPRMRG